MRTWIRYQNKTWSVSNQTYKLINLAEGKAIDLFECYFQINSWSDGGESMLVSPRVFKVFLFFSCCRLTSVAATPQFSIILLLLILKSKFSSSFNFKWIICFKKATMHKFNKQSCLGSHSIFVGFIENFKLNSLFTSSPVSQVSDGVLNTFSYLLCFSLPPSASLCCHLQVSPTPQWWTDLPTGPTDPLSSHLSPMCK